MEMLHKNQEHTNLQINTEKQRTLTEKYLWVDKQILIGKSGTIKLLIILNSKDYQYGKF